jgi:hypothetical protein
VLFLEVSDKARAEASLKRLLRSQMVRSWFKQVGFDLTAIRHQGVSITLLRHLGNDMRFVPFSALTPCYAFVDDFLVITTGVENLKQVVDLSEDGGECLLKDRRFIEMRRLFGERINGVVFLDLKTTTQLSRGVTLVGPLGGEVLTQSEGKKAEDLRQVFQLLESFDHVRTETEFGGDQVRFLVYLAL